MRIFVGILLFSNLGNVGLGQSSEPDAKVRIHRLVIEANSLPTADGERLTHLFEDHIYLQEELQERIHIAFRDLGYFKVRIGEPKVAFIGQTQATKDVDISVKVDEGPQYRLGEIRFEKAVLFSPDRLRSQFPIQTGDLFNVTDIGKGLEQLRNLYAAEGYVNFVGTPAMRVDESRRTIDLVISIDEGDPYNFGSLFLDGMEPHAGAGKALTESWKTLQGKRYSPILLNRWLMANASNWPSAAVPDRMIDRMIDPESHVVNIKLELP